MKRHMLLLCAIVLFLLPTLGVSDGWGRCGTAEGADLGKIQGKVAKLEQKCAYKVAKLQEKLAGLQETHEEELARLEELLANAEFFAEFFGDWDWVAEIEDEIQHLLDRYDLQHAKLYDKIVETQKKYDCKVLKLLLKNGIIPPPEG